LTVTLYDRNQDDVTLTYELRSADMAAAEADALIVIAALAAVTQSIPVGYAVSKRYVENSIVLPTLGENQIKARVSFRLADGQGNETFDIPAPAETIFVQLTGKSNNIVNVGYSTLVTYANLFKATGGKCFISDGEDLDAMTEGRKVSSKTGMRAR
jgi:hypothetical protein